MCIASALVLLVCLYYFQLQTNVSCLRAPGQLPSHDITGWTVTSKFMRTMVFASLDPNMFFSPKTSRILATNTTWLWGRRSKWKIGVCSFGPSYFEFDCRFCLHERLRCILAFRLLVAESKLVGFRQMSCCLSARTLHKSINCSEAYTACPFTTIHVGYLLA